MKVTESYLKGNYGRYCESKKSDGEHPLDYEDWREWFIGQFKVTVEEESPQPVLKNHTGDRFLQSTTENTEHTE